MPQNSYTFETGLANRNGSNYFLSTTQLTIQNVKNSRQQNTGCLTNSHLLTRLNSVPR